jgi:sialate O-acetylesterase
MTASRAFPLAALIGLILTSQPRTLPANVALPNLFSDHAVLQRDMPVPVWGWADPGEPVAVVLGEQTKTTTAGQDGKWSVAFDPLPAGGPHRLVVEGKNRVQVNDVLIGEVWICSGQSNMQWSVQQSGNADLAIASAKYPSIRLLTVEPPGMQKSVEDVAEQWQVCSPESVASFSAVGYYFGRELYTITDLPVGLIDNSWGGSSCEAWVRRDLLEQNELYAPILKRWAETESQADNAERDAAFEKEWTDWTARLIQAKKSGQPLPAALPMPRGRMFDQHRPGNLFHARVKSITPYAVRGAIWYQGESNADRAYQYRELFPLMIQNWRDEWRQGDFPFYWVQLADFKDEASEPGESAWAELREAQTRTMDRLANTGEAVIIDIGEGSDIHPRNKLDVGTRLARWALAHEYGMTDLAHRSPSFKALDIANGKITLTFAHVGRGLRAIDQKDPQGFAVAGEDRKWAWAVAKIVAKDQVELTCEAVPHPVAVRYAWADNPVCNLYSSEGLPATPFRTDDWPGVTAEGR